MRFAVAATAACTGPTSPSSDTDGAAVVDTDVAAVVEKVFEGDFEIGQDSDVAGLVGYTAITGSLTIDSTDPTGPTSLVGLESLTSVGGQLWIDGVANLPTLAGLEHLRSVGGYVQISHARQLVDLSGLDGLRTVGTGLKVDDNESLRTLHGLERLEAVQGSIELAHDFMLGDLHALSSLSSVGGLFDVWFGAMTDLSGLDALQSVGRLRLQSVPVTSLHGLEGLSSAANGFALWSLPNLRSIDALHHVFALGTTPGVIGGLELVSCEKVTNLGAIDGVTTISGPLRLTGTGLRGLPELAHLTSVGGDLNLGPNASLPSLTGLEAVTNVGGAVIVESTGLSDLTGLNGLHAIAGDLQIDGNAALTSLGALDSVVSVGGTLVVRDNASLCDGDVASFSARFSQHCTCQQNGGPCGP